MLTTQPSPALIFQYFKDEMRLRHKREVAFWPDLSEGEEDSVDGGEGGDVLMTRDACRV